MRGPIKRQALNVIVHRGIQIGTVLDVGVLTGTPELMEAFPGVPHILFEPVVEFNPAIERAYRRHRFEIANVAISDRVGDTALELFNMVDVPGHDISHSQVTSKTSGDSNVRTVPMTTLDAFLDGRNDAEPYLLKIDIDGHELAALAGATETLSKSAVVIVEAQIAELPQRIATIVAQGFVLFDLVEPCYYDHALWQCDAILLREDVHKRHFAQLADGLDPSKYTMFGPNPVRHANPAAKQGAV